MYLKKVLAGESPIQGKGYFADEDIPIGTIIYFYAEEDVFYSKEKFESIKGEKKKFLLENAVEDEFGNWVLTSSGPFTNHSCDPNIYPVFVNGKYIDVVVKDIKKGDEVTIDYSMFFSSVKWSMKCSCKSKNCRGEVGFGLDIPGVVEEERSKLMKKAVGEIFKVEQPLFKSSDTNAKEITRALKSMNGLECAKYVKYSIISSK